MEEEEERRPPAAAAAAAAAAAIHDHVLNSFSHVSVRRCAVCERWAQDAPRETEKRPPAATAPGGHVLSLLKTKKKREGGPD